MPQQSLQPEKIRVGSLRHIGDLEVELRRVYRHARKGVISTQDGQRLANIINMMVSIRRDTDLEKRITSLEERGI